MTLPKIIRGMVSADAQLFGLKLKPHVKGDWVRFHAKLTPRLYKTLNANIRKAFLQAIQHMTAGLGGYQMIGHIKMPMTTQLPKKVGTSISEAMKTKRAQVTAELNKLIRAKSSSFVSSYKAKNRGVNKGMNLEHQVNSGIKRMKHVVAAMKKGEKSLRQAAQALLKRRPAVKSIRIDPVYVKCMLRPKTCDMKKITMPKIRVCFTYIGCASTKRKVPPIAQLPSWIKHQARRLTNAWFQRMLAMRTITVKKPTIFRVKTTRPGGKQVAAVHQAKHLNTRNGRAGWKTHIQIQYATYTVPVSIRANKFKAFLAARTQRSMKFAKKLTARGLRMKAVMKKTFAKTDPTDRERMEHRIKIATAKKRV